MLKTLNPPSTLHKVIPLLGVLGRNEVLYGYKNLSHLFIRYWQEYLMIFLTINTEYKYYQTIIIKNLFNILLYSDKLTSE